MFLGTPFRGAPGLTLNEMIRAIDTELQETIQGNVLRILDPEDDSLAEIVDVFERVEKRSLCRAMITCFFEQKPCNVKSVVGKEEKKVFVLLFANFLGLIAIVICCY